MMIVAMLIMAGCVDDEALQLMARDRFDYAFNQILVRAGGDHSMGSVIANPSFDIRDRIEILVNFEDVLNRAGVERQDLTRAIAGGHIDGLLDEFYERIAHLFNHTNHLMVTIEDIEIFEDDSRLIIHSDVRNMRSFPFQLAPFLNEEGRTLSVEANYGRLEVTSDFFMGQGGNDDRRRERLIFSHIEDGNIIRLQVTEDDSDDIHMWVQHPGKSASINIPLTHDFMARTDGNTYNAVYFIIPEGQIGEGNRGILPRSFVCDEYLHIFFNRIGDFQLAYRPHGGIDDITTFLRSRGIVLEENADGFVTRGSFYSGLLGIHWIEYLDFSYRFGNRGEFIDSIPGTDLEGRLHDGRNLRVDLNPDAPYILEGFEDGRFRPGDSLRRSQMFRMVAGNIRYFDLGIDTTYHPDFHPDFSEENVNLHVEGTYWHHELQYLIDNRFVPYIIDEDNNKHLAPYEYVTVQDAEKIIFLMITGGRLY